MQVLLAARAAIMAVSAPAFAQETRQKGCPIEARARVPNKTTSTMYRTMTVLAFGGTMKRFALVLLACIALPCSARAASLTDGQAKEEIDTLLRTPMDFWLGKFITLAPEEFANAYTTAENSVGSRRRISL